MRTFHRLVANTLLSSVTNSFLWFALTFWVFLETRSVAATAVIYTVLIPVVEAAEQTVIQKVVPLSEQGRVFGFAQSPETVAAPVSTFLLGPLAQFVTIPFTTGGAGARLIGGWFGTGPDRGMALLVIAAGLIGLAVTLLAFRTRGYRRLAASYGRGDETPVERADRSTDTTQAPAPEGMA